jgi:hypothetical protein
MFKTIWISGVVAASMMGASPASATGFIGDAFTIKRVQGATTVFQTTTGTVGAGFEYVDNFFNIDVTENEIVFIGGNFSIGDIFYEIAGLDFDGNPQTPNAIQGFVANQIFGPGNTPITADRATITPQGAFRMSFANTTGGAGASARITFGPAQAVVPEPAGWAMMIAGFGLVGGALRQRRIPTRLPA